MIHFLTAMKRRKPDQKDIQHIPKITKFFKTPSSDKVEEVAGSSKSTPETLPKRRPISEYEPIPCSSTSKAGDILDDHDYIGLSPDRPIEKTSSDLPSDDFDTEITIESSPRETPTKCKQTGLKSRKKHTSPHKKKYIQKYVPSWETIPVFAGWLSKSMKKGLSNEDMAYCKICDQNITSGKSEIYRHSLSQRHKQLAMSVKNTKEVTKALFTPTDMKVRRGELKWAAMLAEKNLPISLIDTLIPVAESIYKDSDIAKKMKSKRTKTSCLITNVLGPEFDNSLRKNLRESKFSLVLDETTDKGSIKQCALTVIYYNESKNALETKFLHLKDCVKGDSDHLYQVLKDTLKEKEIPFENLLGFCSDTPNVMVGEYNSVFSKLKNELPQICLIKCSSHQLHLAASQACKKLPLEVEDLLRDIYAHFHRSYQRRVVLAEFQEFYDIEKHNILCSGQTRWLSLKSSVDRLIEQYEALKQYFMLQVFEDPSKTTQNILTTLKKETTICYLHFLSYVLDLVTGLNILFQTDGPVLVKLKPLLGKLIKDLSINYMDIEYVRQSDAWDIDPYNEEKYLEQNKVYLGINSFEAIKEIEEQSKQPRTEELSQVYEHCRNFYTVLVAELQKRFIFKDEIYSFLDILDPKEVKKMSTSTLKPVFDRFSSYLQDVDLQRADCEWRQLALDENLCPGESNDTLNYWLSVFNLKNPANQTAFPNLRKVISLLLCIPSSNASVERVFSQLNLIKTVHRNKLQENTICALLHTKQSIGSCVSYEPEPHILKKKWK